MESGVSAGLALGAEAVIKLNDLLRNTRTAQAWHGDCYDLFTAQTWYFWCHRRVSSVSVVDKTEWKGVIGRCLDDCHNVFLMVTDIVNAPGFISIGRDLKIDQKNTKMRRFSGQRDVPYTRKTNSCLFIYWFYFLVACSQSGFLGLNSSGTGKWGKSQLYFDGKRRFCCIFRGPEFHHHASTAQNCYADDRTSRAEGSS